MKLSIVLIGGKGDKRREYIGFAARSDLNLGNYIVLQTEHSGNKVKTEVYNTFWFPNKEIKKGDYVILNTNSGNQDEISVSGKNMVYFFYWNQEEAIWGDDQKVAVVLHAPEWESSLELNEAE